MTDMLKQREAFEHAYTLSAAEDQRKITLKWMASWHEGDGYSQTNLQEMFRGFLLATSTHISINEVWDALGGDSSLETPSLNAVRGLLKLTRVARQPIPEPGSLGFRGEVKDSGIDYKLADVPTFPKLFEPPMDKRVLRHAQQVAKREFPIQGTLSEFYAEMQNLGLFDRNGVVYSPQSVTPEAEARFAEHVEELRKKIANTPGIVPPHFTSMGMSVGTGRDISKINAADQMFHVVWPAGRRPEGALRMEIQKERTGHKMRFDYQLPDLMVRDTESEESARLRDRAVKADIQRRDRARVDKIMEPLRDFVRENHNSHRARSVDMVLGEHLRIYVRTGGSFFVLNGVRKSAIEIARIDLPEHLQGKGIAKQFFTRELPRIAAMHGISYIVVAQVHNPNFRQQLVAWGYVRDEKRIDDEIYVKVLF